MKNFINALLITCLSIFTAAQADELSLDEQCAIHNKVTLPILKEQATKAPNIYMLLSQGWKISDVLREIDANQEWWAHTSLRSTSMYMAAYMDDHAEDFRDLSDEQMIEWWTKKLRE